MKRFISLLALCLAFGWSTAQPTRLMTFNIRVDFPGDSLNSWELRKGWIAELITFYAPEIIGTQEGRPHQVDYLDSRLPDYNFVGQGRDGGSEGEYSAIFYHNKKLRLITDSTLWLSETPSIPSKGWDAAYNRVLTFAVFENIATSEKFMVLNTHFDHVGEAARENSARLILSVMKDLESTYRLPSVLMGDLNSTPDSKPIGILKDQLKDSYEYASELVYGPAYTFNGFDTGITDKRRIDYLLTNYKVTKFAIIDDQWNGKYPSDHFPVIADVNFNITDKPVK